MLYLDFDAPWPPPPPAPFASQTPHRSLVLTEQVKPKTPAQTPSFAIFQDEPDEVVAPTPKQSLVFVDPPQAAPTPKQNLVFVDPPKPKTPAVAIFQDEVQTSVAQTQSPAALPPTPQPPAAVYRNQPEELAVVPPPAPTPARPTAKETVPTSVKVVKGKPSPTINTKAALADVMNMFGGVQEDDEDEDEDEDDYDDSDDDDDEEEGDVFVDQPIMMVPTKGFVPPTPTPASRVVPPSSGRAAYETPMPEEKMLRRGGALAESVMEEEEEDEDEYAHGDQAFVHEEQRQRPVWQGRVGITELMTPVTERTMERTRSSFGGPPTWGTSSIGASERGGGDLDNGFIAEEDEEEEEEDEQTASSAMNTGKFGLGEGYTINDHSGQSTTFGDVVLVDQTHTKNTVDIRRELKPSRSPTPEVFAQAPISDNNTSSLQVASTNITTNNITTTTTTSSTSSFTIPNPCNPSDQFVVEAIMASLSPPLSELPGFCDFRSQESGKLAGLQKAATKLARRGSTGSAKSSSERESTFGSIQLGDNIYDVKEKLGEGGFGAVFLATDPTSIESATTKADDAGSDSEDDTFDEMIPKLVAIKIEAPSSVWEAIILNRIQTRISPSLRSSIVSGQGLYAFQDESYLVLDYSNQGTLLDAVNKASKIGIAPATQNTGGGGLDELVAIFFTVELLKSVEGLHRANFLHGDLKIDNCMVRLEEDEDASVWQAQYDATGAGGWSNKGIKMIDFGRAIDMSLYPEGQTFIADWQTDARDCVEMREARPWSFQTDYFGLASVLYCMLFGEFDLHKSLKESRY